MSGDRWAVEYSTSTVSGLKYCDTRAEAEAYAAEQARAYGAVTMIRPASEIAEDDQAMGFGFAARKEDQP